MVLVSCLDLDQSEVIDMVERWSTQDTEGKIKKKIDCNFRIYFWEKVKFIPLGRSEDKNHVKFGALRFIVGGLHSRKKNP